MSKRRKKTRGNPAGASERAVPSPSGKGVARPAPEDHSSPRILVYALLGIALFMGLYLHAYAMPQLTYFAEGRSMPGARITGYGEAEIIALQAALEDDAAGQLSFLHKTAGIIFPVAFFLAAWAVLGLLARGTWRWAVLAAAGLFAVVDIAENFLIDRILVEEPVNPETVAAASSLTIISWVLLVCVGGVVLAVVVRDLLPDPRSRDVKG